MPEPTRDILARGFGQVANIAPFSRHGGCSLRREAMKGSELLFFDGNRYFESLLEGIANSRRSVDLETYIFSHDGIGERVLAALAEAAGRGVRVRLIVDGFGSRKSALWIAEKLANTGVQFRVYHPV